MKKSILRILLVIAVIIVGVGAFFLLRTPEFQIVVAASEQVAVTDDGFQIEAGETVTIPQAEVYNRDGEFCEDFMVSREVFDQDGNKKAGTLQMKHGEVYKVIYYADNGSKQLEKTVELHCKDTVVPTVELLNMQKAYNVNEEIMIKVKDIAKDVDYKASSIVLKNITDDSEKKLSFKEHYTFVSKKEAEQYKVVCNLKDTNGNENVQEFPFVILGQFKDDKIAKNDIWDFDEVGYLNNIRLSNKSDDLNYTIVDKDIPKDKQDIGTCGGALKLELKAGETYEFTLVDGNAFQIIDSAAIGFKVWANEVVDIFEIYNVDDNTMSDLSWKVTKRNAWQKVEFASESIFSEDYVLDSLRIIMSCERDVTVYIDSVYYTDYVEPWRDEDLPSDVLAMFDDERYLERVSETSNMDSATFGATWEYVTEISGTTDFTVGAVKIKSTTDPTIREDNNSRDGFKFQFFDRLTQKELEKGVILRVYCEDPHTALAVNFVDKKRGESQWVWPLMYGTSGNWTNVVVTEEDIANIIDGFENITHMNIRFIRNASTAVEGQEVYNSYIDKISLNGLDYSRVKYTFKDDYDMRVVTNLYDGTSVRVQDKEARDGYSLQGTTAYVKDQLSGVEIAFNNLNVFDYSSIYVRMKASDKVEFWINGEYAYYGACPEYTEFDLVPYLKHMGATTLKSLTVGQKNTIGWTFNIDDITFVTKANAPKYEDFTLTAKDFYQNVASKDYGIYEGGQLSNVYTSSIKKGTYHGKTDVVSFKTKKHTEGDYSGGGLYVDFSSKLPNGKIQATVDFTIDLLVYCKTITSARIGLLWGDSEGDYSWKNLWQDIGTETTGWQTLRITSEQLRSLDDCAMKEITGIYIAVNSADCEFAVKEVKVDFGKPDSGYTMEPSWLQKRDNTSIYLSNFNDSSVLNNTDEIGISPWATVIPEELGTTSHGTLKNKDGSFKGIKLAVEGYSGFIYHFPDSFALKNAKQLVFRIASEAQSEGYVPSFVYLTNGDKRVNIIDYCDIYTTKNITGKALTAKECLDGVKYETVNLVLDVAAFTKATGMSSIDGLIFGHSHAGLIQVLDEVYYTTSTLTPAPPEYGQLETTYFKADNLVGGNYNKTDTSNGVQLTGSAWTQAVYDYPLPLNGKDINTITVRFRVTGGEHAIMYFYSGAEYFYVDLNDIPVEYLVNEKTDGEGFTILTFDFKKMSMDSGDSWTPDERATQALTSIGLCCNAVDGAPTFDYVAYNVEIEDEFGTISKTDFNAESLVKEIEVNELTITNKENGVEITGIGWVEAMHYFDKPLKGADITNIQIRYKTSGDDVAIMYFHSGTENEFYVELTNIPEDKILHQSVDAEGFTTIVLDFQTFTMDASDTWLPEERSTLDLTAIGMCTNNGVAKPIFDYVDYNVEIEGEFGTTSKTDFNAESLVKEIEVNELTITNKENGVEITGIGWVEAMHYFDKPLKGADITNIQIRYKTSGDDVAIMYFHSGTENEFYVELTNIPEDKILHQSVDAEGFTTIVLDFQTFTMDASDTWLPEERSTLDLTAIGMCTNNSVAKPIFDYVDYNVEVPKDEGGTGEDEGGSGEGEGSEDDGPETNVLGAIEFSAANMSPSMLTLTDVTGGLQLSGPAWQYAGCNVGPISGADIGTMTIRYKGVNAIIQFYNNEDKKFYVQLENVSGDSVISRIVDSEGFTTLTIDFQTFQKDQSDTWLPAERSTTNLVWVEIGTYGDTVIFDRITFNTLDFFEFSSGIMSPSMLTLVDVTGGLQLSGPAWQYAGCNIGPVNGADIKTMTIRYKGANAILQFYNNEDKKFYVELESVSGDGVISRIIDSEGFTTLTIDFQIFQKDQSDTWMPAERSTTNLVWVEIGTYGDTAIFDYIAYDAKPAQQGLRSVPLIARLLAWFEN